MLLAGTAPPSACSPRCCRLTAASLSRSLAPAWRWLLFSRRWHQGFYAPQYLPTSRGFDSYLGFLSGCEDHLNQLNCCGPCNQTKYGVGKVVDLFGGES